jgi:hypothetical protein
MQVWLQISHENRGGFFYNKKRLALAASAAAPAAPGQGYRRTCSAWRLPSAARAFCWMHRAGGCIGWTHWHDWLGGCIDWVGALLGRWVYWKWVHWKWVRWGALGGCTGLAGLLFMAGSYVLDDHWTAGSMHDHMVQSPSPVSRCSRLKRIKTMHRMSARRSSALSTIEAVLGERAQRASASEIPYTKPSHKMSASWFRPELIIKPDKRSSTAAFSLLKAGQKELDRRLFPYTSERT